MTAVSIRERKKQATRQRLAGAAIKLIERDGVDAVTIDNIARAADVGKGTLYNYFGCKEDILLEFLAGVEAAALAKIAQTPVGARSLVHVLNTAAWTLLNSKANHHNLACVVMARLASGDAAFKQRAESFAGAVLDAFTEMFAKLKHAGLIAARWAPDDLALRFTVLHMGLSLFWAMEGAPFANAKRLTKAQAEIFAKGIAP